MTAPGSGVTRRRFSAVLLTLSATTQILTFTLRPAATYRALELDVPTPWLGALGASFAIVPLLVAVPAGQATDRIGERAVMLAGSGLMAGSAAVLWIFGDDVGGLVAGCIVLGTGHLFAMVGQQAAVANTAAPGHFDAAFGHYTFAASLGQALGPAVIALVGGNRAIPDTRAIFAGATALGIALVLVTLVAWPPRRDRQPGGVEHGGLATLIKVPGLIRALAISCVVLAAVDITLVFLPALGQDRGLTSGLVGSLLVLRAVASMVSRLFLGQLVARLGRRRLMIISIAAAAASMAAVSAPLPPAALLILITTLGLGLGVGQPLTMSWLAEVAPPGLRGRAMSLRLTGNRLGQVVIPSTVGAVAAGIGAPGVLWATAAALTGAGLAARQLTTHPPTPEPPTPEEHR